MRARKLLRWWLPANIYNRRLVCIALARHLMIREAGTACCCILFVSEFGTGRVLSSPVPDCPLEKELPDRNGIPARFLVCR